jgi:protocatechuate 3,4-dioxygenase beta subunit
MKWLHQLSLGLGIALALSAVAQTGAPQPFRLKGTVVDADGRPVDGATVESYSTFQSVRFAVENEAVQRVTTTNGAFEVQLPGQGALILVRKAGLPPTWRQFWRVASDQEARLTFGRPSTLSGLVVDEKDKPVADAEVSVSIAILEVDLEGGGRSMAYLGGKPARECFSARTSAEGRFRIEGFPTTAWADLSARVSGKAFRQAIRENLDPTSLQARAGQEDLRLVVEPAGHVEGKIVADVAGQPLPIARLSLQPGPGPGFAESRADGTFRIPDMPPGNYRVHAVFGTNPVPDWIAESVPVSVEAGQTAGGVQISATRGGLLEVTILEKKDRRPIAQASVNAYQPRANSFYQAAAVSASDGKALLRLLPGDYQVQVSLATDGTRQEATSATVEPGKTNAITVEMAGPARLAGVVRRPDGQPAAGVAIGLIGSYMSYGDTGPKTDANGKFEIPIDVRQFRQPDRTVCVLARDPEHNLAVAQDLDEDTTALDLRLGPGLTLAGRAVCEGKPLTNATAALVFWTGNSGQHVQGWAVGTNIPGQFELPALPPGRRYGLYVSAPGYGQKYVNAADAETEAKRIELDPAELKLANLKLAGQVMDADDKPVVGASVNLNGEGQPFGNTRTDRDGRFLFDHVCEGSVRLYANARGMSGNISAEGGQTNVVLKLGESSNYAPGAKPRKLKGLVVDPDGEPVAGAQVAVFPAPSSRVKTDTNGAFTLNWTMQPWQVQRGRGCSLVVRYPPRNLAAVDSLSDDTTNAQVQLRPALTVVGSVQDHEGRPMPNAQVGTWLMAAQTYSEANDQPVRSDAQGRFEIKALPFGPKYTFYATANGYGRDQQELPAANLEDRVELPPLVLELANQVVAGRVVNEEDKPVSGVYVSLSGKNQPSLSATTDSKGRFNLKVCEGSIRLFASGSSGSANVSVVAGDTNVLMQLARNDGSGRSVRVGALGSALSSRHLTPFGFATNAVPRGKPLLLCLFDAEQPPSRRSAQALASRYGALRQKGVNVLAVQATVIPSSTWQTWTNSNPMPFPLGRAQRRSSGTKWAGEVESLPWFILRNANGTVVGEGFPLDELDAKLKALKP